MSIQEKKPSTATADRPGSPKQRQSKAETKRTILEHAYEMYLEGRLDRSDVKVAAVLRELGYTTGAAYYIWPNQAAFRRDLMLSVAERVEYSFLESMPETIKGLQSTNRSFRDAVLRGSDAYIDYFLAREDFYLKLRFFEDPEQDGNVAKAMSLGYERVQGEVHRFFEASLSRWGKRMTDEDEYSLSDLVVSTSAMVEGFALRHRFQPTRVLRRMPFNGGQHYLFSVNMCRLAESVTCDA